MAVFEDDYTALNYKAVTPRLRKQSKSCFTSPASSDHPALFLMVVVSILPQAEFGPNDHREGAPHFMNCSFKKDIQIHFFIIVSRLRNRMRHEFLTYYNGVE